MPSRKMTEQTTLLARAGLVNFVGTLFAYPEEQPDFRAARRAAERLGSMLSKDVERTAAAWKSADLRELQSQWLRLFSLMPLCPPYETAMCDDATRKGTILADVAGFYRAFGLQPENEMGDHIASEMGFAAHLLAKLAYAETRGWADRVEVTRGALQSFFGEHLGPFAAEFFPRAEVAGGPFYRAAARLGQHVARELRRAVNGAGASRTRGTELHRPSRGKVGKGAR